MKQMSKSIAFLLVAALAGCATVPSGPSVNVLPARGKSFETFRLEDDTCRQWAERQLGTSPQENYDKSVAAGATTGTAIGAGIGAMLGSATGHMGAGALIGAGYGLLVGSASGANAGGMTARQAQRNYDYAYMQCMYSYGNQIPGYRRAAASPPVASAPPPPPPAVSAPPAVAAAPPELVDPEEAAPGEIYFDESPRFIYAPELGYYVAVGVPYDLVYTGRDYYYFRAGRWYRSAYCYGPWTYAPRSRTSPVFVRYNINRVRSYREAEFRRYERDRAHYEGRWHRPEAFRGRYREERRGRG